MAPPISGCTGRHWLPRPKQRTEELRRHIVQTAVGLIAADGVAGFTTRRVVEEASTSIPAMYELFGDRSGLVRENFFEGFRLLGGQLEDLEPSSDPRADLVRVVQKFRRFHRENPVLARVMFSRPFPDFDPGLPRRKPAVRCESVSSDPWSEPSRPEFSRATPPISPT